MVGIALKIGVMALSGWMLNSAPENQVNQSGTSIAGTASVQATAPSTTAGTAGSTDIMQGLNAEQQMKMREYLQMRQQQRSLQFQQQPIQPGTQSGTATFTPPATNPIITNQPLNQPSNQARPWAAGMRPQQPLNSNSFMPPSPTEPVRSTTLGMMGMPSAPTTNMSDTNIDAQAEAANLNRGPGTAITPQVTAGRMAYPPRTADTSMYGEMSEQRKQSLSTSHPTFYNQVQPVDKPMANAQVYSSGVSPWMNLYRNEHDNGVVNNYYTLVKPALDQRSMNQQFNTDIYGMERNNRIQNAQLQQLNSANQRALQSVSTPQFMNYGGYYPNYNQQNQAVGQ